MRTTTVISLAALAILMAASLSSFAAFSGAERTGGEECKTLGIPEGCEGYIQIGTFEQLIMIGNDAGHPLSGNYVLTDNIICEEGLFRPIGNNSTGDDNSRFTGIFEGDGFTISGVDHKAVTSGNIYAGLFGYVSGATIRNLSVVSDIEVRSLGRVYTGGIAGYADSATKIENCRNAGSISAETALVVSVACAGGIAGYADSATIENCFNTGSIIANTTATSSSAHAGGIAGHTVSTTIENCCNAGSITEETNAGGIAGHADSATTIENCCNTGYVSSKVVAGGIAGTTNGATIKKCYNTGNICTESAQSSARPPAGGIAGYAFRSTIKDCYNAGEVTVNVTGSTAVAFAGGIAGYADGATTIENCYNMGGINAIARSALSEYAGGITGRINVNGETVILSHCYFLEGKVTGDKMYDASEVITVEGNAASNTSSEMTNEETYTDAGWDFDNVWTIIDGKNDGYPILQVLAASVPSTVLNYADVGTTSDISMLPVSGAATDSVTAPSVAAGNGYAVSGAWTSGSDSGDFSTSGSAVYTITLTADAGYTFDGTDMTTGTFTTSDFPLAASVSVNIGPAAVGIAVTYDYEPLSSSDEPSAPSVTPEGPPLGAETALVIAVLALSCIFVAAGLFSGRKP